MKIVETAFGDPSNGVVLLEPRSYADPRGYFLETWRDGVLQDHGIRASFRQDNMSVSRKGVLRGLHFQNPNPQGKLVMVAAGAVFDVAVDLRRSSPTFGKWYGTELSEENHRQLWIPPGFAHGFLALSETATFLYKCTDVYAPGAEGALAWNDPDVDVRWPVDPGAGFVISPKDEAAPRLRDIPDSKLFP